MCKNCRIIEETFQAAGSNPHMNYVPIYRMLEAMLGQNRIEIYAGEKKDAISVNEIFAQKRGCFTAIGLSLLNMDRKIYRAVVE